MSERSNDPRVLPHITNRWSPRSFDGSTMPAEDLETILKAAGLAPSAFNNQPWTFLYAHKGDENWDRFLSLLVEFNQSWAKDASVLLFVASDRMGRGGSTPQPNHSHSFDAGAAWMGLALQAAHMGYAAHGMTGVNFDAAIAALNIPEDYRLEAAVAIGKQAPADQLPEMLRGREVASGRKPVGEIMKAGNFA
ncbi:MAG: nitroreductase family protein [Pontixanthobacter sp.]